MPVDPHGPGNRQYPEEETHAGDGRVAWGRRTEWTGGPRKDEEQEQRPEHPVPYPARSPRGTQVHAHADAEHDAFDRKRAGDRVPQAQTHPGTVRPPAEWHVRAVGDVVEQP